MLRAALAGGCSLLLIALCAVRFWPADSRPITPPPTSWLVDATRTAGLWSDAVVAAPTPPFFPEIMGSGCALFDFDQDGDLDLLLIGGAWPARASAQTSHNRLYRQESDGAFQDITAGSGLMASNVGMGVAVGDVDNDGFPDVYITNHGPDKLYRNQRDGTFRDITAEAGIDNLRWGMSCSFVDYDRDGWLDLFVTNYIDEDPARKCVDPSGMADYCNPQLFDGTPDKLYHNESGAQPAEAGAPPRPLFRDVSLASGIARRPGPGLGVACGDFNEDGWPDIYVANDGANNFLWVNQRDGTFVEEGILRGAANDIQGRPQGSMGVALGDVNADGSLDLFVTNLAGEANALYLSQPPHGFEDRAARAGLAQPSFPLTGFGAFFLDLEHDGDLDLAVVNGRVKRPTETQHVTTETNSAGPQAEFRKFLADYAEPNDIYVNDGIGNFHHPVAGCEAFTAPAEISRGLAAGDIDNDGDLDLLVTNIGAAPRLWRNASPKCGHWLQLRAILPKSGGRDAYGARLTIVAGEQRWRRLVNPALSYLSSSDPRVHLGLGPVTQVDKIEVVWPDGAHEIFPGGPVDQMVILSQGAGSG
jgi:hypothetical protein